MIRFFLILSFLLWVDVVTAVNSSIIAAPSGVITTTPVDLVSKIITYAIGIAAILWVIGITWWGIQMILSVGEDEKLKKWQRTVIYSIVGVVLAWLAYGIVNLIGNIRI
jgi:Type IV secretion system pilin